MSTAVLILSVYALSLITGGLVILTSHFSVNEYIGFRPSNASKTPAAVDSSLPFSNIPIAPLLRIALFPLVLLLLLPSIGIVLGRYFITGTRVRRTQIVSRAQAEQRATQPHRAFDEEEEERELVEEARRKSDSSIQENDFDGVVGFLHPFCNAGGGGERVLWAAIRSTQVRYPRCVCVVYTGDHEATKSEMLTRARDRFGIAVPQPSHVQLLYLTTRRWVLASQWPRFTLAGQSLGSLVMLADAFTLLVPDVFVDTMGYAFSLAGAKWLVPGLPVGAYVHYPTISMDMLATLDDKREGVETPVTIPTGEGGTGLANGDRAVASKNIVGHRGLNAGTGAGWKGHLKKLYWHLFAWLYGWAGGNVDVVMTNSSWTQSHVQQLWGSARRRQKRESEIEVVFPPCAVDELASAVEVDGRSEEKREKVLLYIAQFRPEKNHELILHAFAEMLRCTAVKNARLILVGSVRDDVDNKFVYKLRLLANELGIAGSVKFEMNAPWPDILEWLRKASVGVNGMWNEHFGIGIVEYQAAGLISVVNDSGGPKLDIVTNVDGEPTGFHASTVKEYAEAFERALSLGVNETMKMRQRARKSAKRFTEEEFEKRWLLQLGKLIHLKVYPKKEEANPSQQVLMGIFAMLVLGDLRKLLGPYIEEVQRRSGWKGKLRF